jgi:hypothetical protein
VYNSSAHGTEVNVPTLTRHRKAFDTIDQETRPALIFCRASAESVRVPSDIVSLMNAEGIKTGTLRARNPITHDQWWIPLTALMAAGAPYAKALASVIKTWLNEKKGRQVRLEVGGSKITANTVTEVKRLLAALRKHETHLGLLHVTKARVIPVQKPGAKRKRKNKVEQNGSDMTAGSIELTVEERALVAQIDFDPTSSRRSEPGYWNAVGEAALRLMKSLIARNAIPEVRMRYFSDADFNVGGRGRSRAQTFEKNGTRGEAIFRHPHFLKYLHYFLYGPDLPPQVIDAFRDKIADIGFVTSSDIIPLGAFGRQMARANRLDAGHAAEEFFKLALDCGFELYEARSIRDSVKTAR